VFSAVQSTILGFSISRFHGTFEASKTKISGIAIDGQRFGHSWDRA